MNEKVPCVECGSPIRASKTSRMKGLCVRCFAKRIQRKTNPFSDLYASLIHRVHELDGGFDALSEAEKLYYSVALLRNEINNGGFHQYFFNSSGSYYKHAEEGLETLGAMETLQLLREAKAIVFPEISVPAEMKARRMHMARVDPDAAEQEWVRKLDELDGRFYDSPDEITSRLETFAKGCGLVEAL
jgi:Domain of unknown function (DUF4375)